MKKLLLLIIILFFIAGLGYSKVTMDCEETTPNKANMWLKNKLGWSAYACPEIEEAISDIVTFEAESEATCVRTGAVSTGTEGGNTYIQLDAAGAKITCTVNIPQTGNWYMWTHHGEINSASDSMHVVIDGEAAGDTTAYHFTPTVVILSGLHWGFLNSGATPAAATRRTINWASTGNKTIEFQFRESGARLSSVILYHNDEDAMPTGAEILVTSFNPTSCDINGTGCTGVQITAENMTATPDVVVGSNPATSEALSNYVLTADFPTQASEGQKTVTITNPNGTVGTSSFTYTTAGVADNILWISPTGTDTGFCKTEGSPCATLLFAVNLAQPGETIKLKNGTYTNMHTTINCSGTPSNGLQGAPITIQAENERLAFIDSNGSANPIKIEKCSYWVVDGLRISGAHNAGQTTPNGSTLILVKDSSNITIKNTLNDDTNGHCSCHGIAFIGPSCTTHLAEENEVYDFHQHGIQARPDCRDVTFRRNYVNGRGYTAPAGGQEGNNVGGDEGLVFYYAQESIMENNIAENTHYIGDYGKDNQLLGNISLNNTHGFIPGTRQKNDATPFIHERSTVINNVAFKNKGVGFYSRSPLGSIIENNTAINNGTNASQNNRSGFSADNSRVKAGVDVDLKNNLSLHNATNGFNLVDGADFTNDTWTYLNANGNGTNYSSIPAGTSQTTTAVADMWSSGDTDECIVYIPTGSVMENAGEGGTTDKGANVVCAYEDGEFASPSVDLWNQSTGVFIGCGVQISGVNNTASTACAGVHDRLNVGSAGCGIPNCP